MTPATNNKAPSTDARQEEVTWQFRCRRSGRCCQVKGGVAWVSEAEQQAIAKHMQLEPRTFHSQHVRELTDPVSGHRRQALRDRADGACGLLDGANECSVYEARPAQCRDFPFWDSVTGDPKGFERAKTVCPGIEAVPSTEFTARVASLLEQLLEAGPSSPSPRCPHEDRGTQLHISGLEAQRIARASGLEKDTCPLWKDSACSSPKAQPIACREWPFEEQSEEAYERLRQLEKEAGYPRKIGPLPQLLRECNGDGLSPLLRAAQDPEPNS